MPISLYDAVIPSCLQVLGAIDAMLAKAEAFCTETGRAASDLIDARLAPDMLPFGYQVKSCVVHAVGGINGTKAGRFAPDQSPWPTDFASLHALVQQAITDLNGLDRAAVDALVDQDTRFEFGETRFPFTGANFLLSFSQPNFYFHASMAYAILRAQGVNLGKRDFLGAMRMAQ